MKDKSFGIVLLLVLSIGVMAAGLPGYFDNLQVYDSGRTAHTTITQDGTNLDIDTGVDVTGAVSATGAVSGTNGTFTGALTVDTSTLAVDAVNNRVGINKASPAYALDVAGDIGVTSNAKLNTVGRFYIGNSGGYLVAYQTGSINYLQSVDAAQTGTQPFYITGQYAGTISLVKIFATDTEFTGSVIVGEETTVGDFIELAPVSTPATPASGSRIWMDSTTGNIMAIDSTGTTTTLGTF